jgi:hypothetical protein
LDRNTTTQETLPRQLSQQHHEKMAKQIANPDLPAPPSGKYPAKSHSRRVAKWLAENGGPEEGVIYLEGQALREHEVWGVEGLGVGGGFANDGLIG